MISYVVYKVHYSGHNLSAKYYIGYTTKKRANSGKYFGSVSSVKWKDAYFKELNRNPQFFRFEILSEWKTQKEAVSEELRLQILNDVVNSPDYFNESFAKVNGCYGKHSKQAHDTIEKRAKKLRGQKRTEESRKKMSESQKGLRNRAGKPCSEETKQKLREARKNQSFTPEQIEKRRLACIGKKRKVVSCPHCGKQGGGGAMERFHFNNCKQK